ncbi:hypothetical protein SANTM175S_09689 [Streptomyces antimycoticus]
MPGQRSSRRPRKSSGLDMIGSRRRAGRKSTPSPGRPSSRTARAAARAVEPALRGPQLERVRQQGRHGGHRQSPGQRPRNGDGARQRVQPGADQQRETDVGIEHIAVDVERMEIRHRHQRGRGQDQQRQSEVAQREGARAGSGPRAQTRPVRASAPKPSSSGGPGAEIQPTSAACC